MSFTYSLVLITSSIGMMMIDKKYSLALFSDWRRTIMTVGCGLAMFIIWDILGIILGIFFSGHSPYMSGWYLMRDFPIEEILFLMFLCYFTLVMYRCLEKVWRRI